MKIKRNWAAQISLPEGFVPAQVYPRAYCSAKPGVKTCVFATPPMDSSVALAKVTPGNYKGEVIRGNRLLGKFEVGDWATLVFGMSSDRPNEWFAVPAIEL